MLALLLITKAIPAMSAVNYQQYNVFWSSAKPECQTNAFFFLTVELPIKHWLGNMLLSSFGEKHGGGLTTNSNTELKKSSAVRNETHRPLL